MTKMITKFTENGKSELPGNEVGESCASCSKRSKCSNSFKIMKSPTCICLMIYGFFHWGGMIGTVIFLPPLLQESLIPKGNASLNALEEGQVNTFVDR